jgi:hypothetical protein
MSRVSPQKCDKPCYLLQFSDGASPMFYLDKHPKAHAEMAHIFLKSEEVFILG